MLDYRSLSPKSRDGKLKKEKNIKAEEEEEETKKKEKVKNCLALLASFCGFLFVFYSLKFISGPTFIFGRASCQEEGSRGSRGKGEMVIAIILSEILLPLTLCSYFALFSPSSFPRRSEKLKL